MINNYFQLFGVFNVYDKVNQLIEIHIQVPLLLKYILNIHNICNIALYISSNNVIHIKKQHLLT